MGNIEGGKITMTSAQWDALRAFIENAWYALANLLSYLGEWPLF